MATRIKATPTSKIKAKARELLSFALELAPTCKNSMEFRNAIYGKDGKANELFSSQPERAAFLRTEESREIRKLSSKLPDPPLQDVGDLLANGNLNIQVRVPRSVHDALVAEAATEGVSLEQLCLSKLVAQLRELV
jgi:hypothetical protein